MSSDQEGRRSRRTSAQNLPDLLSPTSSDISSTSLGGGKRSSVTSDLSTPSPSSSLRGSPLPLLQAANGTAASPTLTPEDLPQSP